MAVRLRGWLPWSAGLMMTVAGCRTASPPPPVSRQYLEPRRPVARTIHQAPAYTVAPTRAPVTVVATSGLEEQAEQRQPEPKPAPEKPPVEKPPVKPLGERLQLPAGLPGRDAPVIALPEMKPENEAKRKAAIDSYFPPLGPLADPLKADPGPDGKPLALADLRRIALANNPSVRQALAAVEAAQGSAIQSGLYPNPRLGYAGDEINSGNSAGKHGAFIEQTIKVGHKLQLARAAAQVDVDNAELASRKNEIDVAMQVRRGYYSVLVAERAYSIARAFATLTAEVYSIQVTRLRLGQAAVYEPLQARVLAMQARASLIQAHNRTIASWKQLAATLGQPSMRLTALAGSLDMDVPRFVQDDVLARVLSQHTDVVSAENLINKAQLLLRLAEVTPRPDLGLHYQLQYDTTTQPNNAIHSASVGIEVPLWNRNQGAIREARANLSRAADDPQRIRNDLTSLVAAAFEKYDNARTLVLYYRDRMVPDQVRAYRGIYRRYDSEPDALNFNDVITAQQTLADTIRSYVDSIGGLWSAVTDLASLLQLDDLDPAAVSGKGALDHCPVPPLEPLMKPSKPEQSKPMPQADKTISTPAPLPKLASTEKTVVSNPAPLPKLASTEKKVETSPAPLPKLASTEKAKESPPAPVPQLSSTQKTAEPTLKRVGIQIRRVEWTRATVPFEVRELRDGNRRIIFNVIPLQ